MDRDTIHSFFEDTLATYGAYGLKVCVNRNVCQSTTGIQQPQMLLCAFSEHLKRIQLEMYNVTTF